MRRFQWMTLVLAIAAAWSVGRPASAQPGHAPFSYSPFEIDDFERTTITSPEKPALGNVGQPIAIRNSDYEYGITSPAFKPPDWSGTWIGGVLGTTDGTTTYASDGSNWQDMYPGGWTVAIDTVNYGQCCGANNNWQPRAAYNHTQLQVISKTDPSVSAGDKLGITSGNQALKISMWNVGQGDGDTSFDRPVMLTIKKNDFYGVSDSRFASFEQVRQNPSQYNLSADITVVADDVPDTFTYGLSTSPYFKIGFFAHNGTKGIDETPASILQGPDALAFSNSTTGNPNASDGKPIPNFSLNTYVDPNNPAGLPGKNVAGVMQRRYVFPASAIDWPDASIDTPDPTPAGAANRWETSSANTYMLGLVFNGNWALNTPASFIIDNFHFVPRNPIVKGDFNNDGLLNRADWQILIGHLNGAGPYNFAGGDIGSYSDGSESAVSPGVVDFQDYVRFEQLWDANHGAGSFSDLLTGVPEPSSVVLMLLGLVAAAVWKKRLPSRAVSLLAAVVVAGSASIASAQLSDVTLFDFETPPDPNPQQWTVAGDAATAVGINPPTVSFTSSVGATHGTRSMTVTQSTTAFSWDAAVSIFGGSNLPDQTAALNAALDYGASFYAIDFDVTYKQSEIPFGPSFVNMSMRFNAGSLSDQVDNLALGGDGSGNVPDQTIHVSVPLSNVAVNTGDTVLSVPDTSASAGFYNIEFALNHDGLASNTPPALTAHIDNIRIKQTAFAPILTLEVNTVTGDAKIKKITAGNAGPGPATLDYYEVRSTAAPNAADGNADGTVNAADYTVWRDHLGQTVPAGTLGDYDGNGTVQTADYNLWKANFGQGTGATSLNPAGWNSLDAQNIDAVDDRGGVDAGSVAGDSALEGWDKSGTPSSSVLSEAFLLGSSTRDDGQFYDLGNIYTPVRATQHLVPLSRPSTSCALRTGFVTYVNAGAAVPEPATITLSFLALAAGMVYRGRQTSPGLGA